MPPSMRVGDGTGRLMFRGSGKGTRTQLCAERRKFGGSTGEMQVRCGRKEVSKTEEKRAKQEANERTLQSRTSVVNGSISSS